MPLIRMQRNWMPLREFLSVVIHGEMVIYPMKSLQKQGCKIDSEGLKVDSSSEDEAEIEKESRLFAEKLINESVVTA